MCYNYIILININIIVEWFVAENRSEYNLYSLLFTNAPKRKFQEGIVVGYRPYESGSSSSRCNGYITIILSLLPLRATIFKRVAVSKLEC
jgi:hypothetical protein